MTQRKINKIVKGLEKASKTHAKQAKTLKTIKMNGGGSAKKKKDNIPDNVANPSLYRKAKAKAKAKFDVYPSAYANSWMVREYKKMGGKYRASMGGEATLSPKSGLKPIPKENKGLPKLPTKVRNRMGYMSTGGTAMIQARGCGAIDPSKQKMTRVPRS
jgi:hypothetical protein